MPSSSDISDNVVDKLRMIVKDETELAMIMDLLKNERRYTHGNEPVSQTIKKEFNLLLEQYFPLPSENK